MKFIKFIFLAVGAFVELIIFLWIVVHLWWLFLAVIALFIAYGFMCDKKEEVKSDPPGEKSSTSNDPFEKD
ncbi:MAG: hypothetical protein ABIJ52_17265 [Pseudomonadota bacterium]